MASKIAPLRPGVSGTAYHIPGKCTGHPAFFNHRYTVDEHVGHTDGESIRSVVCRHSVNRGGIEHHEVGPHALFDHSAVGEVLALRGERRELANGVRQAELALLAHVLGEDPRIGPIGARVWMVRTKDTFGRSSRIVIVN